MKRSASEVIRNLESRIAKLEKQSSVSVDYYVDQLEEMVDTLNEMDMEIDIGLEENPNAARASAQISKAFDGATNSLDILVKKIERLKGL